MNLRDGRGCDTIPGILALFSHTLRRLGPVRWLEIMRRGEFVGALLTPCFSSTFIDTPHSMTSYTSTHPNISLPLKLNQLNDNQVNTQTLIK